jgi:hypothetical protein
LPYNAPLESRNRTIFISEFAGAIPGRHVIQGGDKRQETGQDSQNLNSFHTVANDNRTKNSYDML